MENVENILCGFILFLDKSGLSKLVTTTDIAQKVFFLNLTSAPYWTQTNLVLSEHLQDCPQDVWQIHISRLGVEIRILGYYVDLMSEPLRKRKCGASKKEAARVYALFHEIFFSSSFIILKLIFSVHYLEIKFISPADNMSTFGEKELKVFINVKVCLIRCKGFH